MIVEEDDEEDARSTGLLFLSLSRLQAYASRYLPLVVRQEFLEDLANPQLARAEKVLVVSRVWRCWGGVGGVLEA
jgi:nuclear-control-of-ATPase protein 2